MITAHSAVLSDLCSICNKAVPKYCCPRDGTKTCSLACVSKHKERAVCNGKRDPTTFVKKDRLETPAGIDHDYNFLTGIERSVTDAETRSKEHGVGARRRPKKADYGFERRLRETRVIVDRAPRGLSRQMTNKTFYSSKDDALHWTIEWVVGDQRIVAHPVPDNIPIEECYALMLRQNKKRKLNAVSTMAADHDKRHAQMPKSESASQAGPSEAAYQVSNTGPATMQIEPSAANVQPHPEDQPHPVGSALSQATDPPTASNVINPAPAPQSIELPEPTTKASPTAAEQPEHSTTTATTTNHSPPSSVPVTTFHLLVPSTPAHLPRPLIPLSPASSLKDCLRERLVLEYPTIFVLHTKPAAAVPSQPAGASIASVSSTSDASATVAWGEQVLLPKGYISEQGYHELLSRREGVAADRPWETLGGAVGARGMRDGDGGDEDGDRDDAAAAVEEGEVVVSDAERARMLGELRGVLGLDQTLQA